ncbi:MAG: NADH-quinone oxidoreductase subunit C [Planctomycetota bacterium]|nr:NADH-quinone oxidoreductase subunit C [Planctomycetota bacterium]
MDFDQIVAKLQARWPEVEAPEVANGERVVLIPPAKNLEILRFLKEDPELSFDSLMTVGGADNGWTLWVVYPLHSFKHLHKLLVKAVLEREAPSLDSVVGLWGAADFFEREAFDLFGIEFRGHPDLRRILNPPDWEGFPCRKDFEYPKEYQGIPTTRLHQFFASQVKHEIAAREEDEKKLVEKLTAEVKKEMAEEAKKQKAAAAAAAKDGGAEEKKEE